MMNRNCDEFEIKKIICDGSIIYKLFIIWKCYYCFCELNFILVRFVLR